MDIFLVTSCSELSNPVNNKAKIKEREEVGKTEPLFLATRVCFPIIWRKILLSAEMALCNIA